MAEVVHGIADGPMLTLLQSDGSLHVLLHGGPVAILAPGQVAQLFAKYAALSLPPPDDAPPPQQEGA